MELDNAELVNTAGAAVDENISRQTYHTNTDRNASSLINIRELKNQDLSNTIVDELLRPMSQFKTKNRSTKGKKRSSKN